MTVYVDDAKHKFGRMIFCHCWADSDTELLAMMARIGVDKKWIQGHPTLSFGKHKNASWIHFDIAKGKRDLAVQHGAVACDRYQPLIHCARLDLRHANPEIRAHGRRRMRLALNAQQKPLIRLSQLWYQMQEL